MSRVPGIKSGFLAISLLCIDHLWVVSQGKCHRAAPLPPLLWVKGFGAEIALPLAGVTYDMAISRQLTQTVAGLALVQMPPAPSQRKHWAPIDVRDRKS